MHILEEIGIEFLNEEAQQLSNRLDARLTAPM
jgi:trimethylamine:corrinoid methyltransferase-like protein